MHGRQGPQISLTVPENSAQVKTKNSYVTQCALATIGYGTIGSIMLKDTEIEGLVIESIHHI